MTFTFKILMAALITITSATAFTPAQSESSFADSLAGLTSSKLKDRSAAIDILLRYKDERLPNIINSLLNNQLFYRKSDNLIAFIRKEEKDVFALTVLSNKKYNDIALREWKKIIINNRLRTKLRSALAIIDLNNPSPVLRLSAIRQVLKQIDVRPLPALSKRLNIETDEEIKDLLELTISTLNLKVGDGDKLESIDKIKGSMHPSVRQVLLETFQNEDDPESKIAAQEALQAIERKLDRYSKIETLFFGLSLGSVLVLAAIGLAITFGVMGVINMAHGELIMLGAYATYVVQICLPTLTEYSVIIAIPVAFIISSLAGILIERGVIRFLYGRPLETLLATFGISLILQQLVRSIFGPLNRAVITPSWMSGIWQINEALGITWNRLYIILFSLLVFALLFFILKKTRLGLMVRAVSQNRLMARAMGIKANWVDSMTFGLGSGIAGIAGVALSQLTNVGSNLGQAYIIDSFMVVVFGGVGNLWGTLVAGFGLGITNKLLEPWSGAILAKIIVLLFIIVFIQKRPRGLFPQKGRAAEN